MEVAKPQTFIGRVIQRFSKGTTEKRSLVRVGLRDTLPQFFGPKTKAGTEVDEESANRLNTVYSCISLISQSVAGLPIQVFKKDGATRLPIDHAVTPLITESPKFGQIAFDFWEEIVANACGFGRGFAIISRDTVARPTELRLVHPREMECTWRDGKEYFRERGKAKVYTQEDVLIVSAFRGLSPIRLHRELVGLGMSQQDFASRFFGRGGNMSGIISADGKLTPEARADLKTSWQSAAHGMEQSHGTALLDQGMKYTRISVSPKDADYVEGRKMNATEICSIFKVAPSLINLDSGVKFNNQEQQFIRFVQMTLQPWVQRIEQEIKAKLISHLETDVHVRFNLAGLLRGDTAARKDFYHTMLTDGVFSINEVRAYENMNPVEGGDVHLVQVNQLPLDKINAYGEKLTTTEQPNGE